MNQLLNPVLSAEGLFRQVQQPKADILAETNTKKLRTYPTNKTDNWIGTSAVPSLPNSYVGSEQVQDSPPGPSPSLATPISTIVEQVLKFLDLFQQTRNLLDFFPKPQDPHLARPTTTCCSSILSFKTFSFSTPEQTALNWITECRWIVFYRNFPSMHWGMDLE